MKLFLTSYRTGSRTAELLELLGGIKKVAFISNAKDYKTKSERAKSMKENFDFWRSINVEPTEIDLRPYFHKDGAEKLLDDFKFVWLAGGNTFLLRRALSYTGLDSYLIRQVKEGSLIYGGESAGAIMAGPTLEDSEDDASIDEDNPHFTPEGYEDEVIWTGLGLVDFVPVPHYKSPDYGVVIDQYVDSLRNLGVLHKTITEDQAIIVRGAKTELLK